MESKTGAAAVDYVRRGLAIIALEPRKKKPSFTHGLTDATTHLGDVRDWYERYPDDNVAIVTGKVSGGIGVIDIDYDEDDGKDGYEFLRAWEKVNGELPETWQVLTARGGCHMYYRFEGNVPPNSANEELAIDFRGEGGYVMAPPSVHPNGTTVEWEQHPDDYELATADARVMRFLEAIRSTKSLGVTGRFELPERISKGERDNTLFKYACSLQSQGMSDAEITVLVHDANERRCEVPLSRAAVDQKVRQALQYDKGAPIDLANVCAEESVNLTFEKNKPANTIDNCIEVLTKDKELKGRFVYDQMAYTRKMVLPVPWRGGSGIVPIRDADYVEATAYAEYKYMLHGKDNMTNAVVAVCERSPINPVRDYLRSTKWDGIDRISRIFNVFLGAANSDYNAAVAHLLFLGGVARAMTPGCKFDYMPVLVGNQGQGKSYFVSRLATRPEWYLDNLSTFKGDAAVEKVRGVWVAEVSELAAMKGKAEVEAVKAFITTRFDTIRPKYARETEQRPRTCVLVGTTNEHGFLTDLTGNRRYLPVQTAVEQPTMDMFDASVIVPYIDQCWAQAFAKWEADRPALVMPMALMEQAEREQDEHMEDDPTIGLVQAFLDDIAMDARNIDKRVCLAQICEGALGTHREDYVKDRQMSTHLSRIMHNHIEGWEPCGKPNLGGEWGRQRAWQPIGWSKALMVIQQKFEPNGQMFEDFGGSQQ